MLVSLLVLVSVFLLITNFHITPEIRLGFSYPCHQSELTGDHKRKNMSPKNNNQYGIHYLKISLEFLKKSLTHDFYLECLMFDFKVIPQNKYPRVFFRYSL